MARRTIKSYAQDLLLVTVLDDGRNVGLSYLEIIRKIKRNLRVVTYGGPHRGQPIRLTVKELQKIAYAMRRDPDIIFPTYRPKKRGAKRIKS